MKKTILMILFLMSITFMLIPFVNADSMPSCECIPGWYGDNFCEQEYGFGYNCLSEDYFGIDVCSGGEHTGACVLGAGCIDEGDVCCPEGSTDCNPVTGLVERTTCGYVENSNFEETFFGCSGQGSSPYGEHGSNYLYSIAQHFSCDSAGYCSQENYDWDPVEIIDDCIDGTDIGYCFFDSCISRDEAIDYGLLFDEVCNNLDDDCDGIIDDSLQTSCACSNNQYSQSEEICDSIDNDCNDDVFHPLASRDTIDEGCDDDNDHFADENMDCVGTFIGGDGYERTCEANGGDCDDDNGNAFPGAPEICNALSDDCDAQIDENLVCDMWSMSGNLEYADYTNIPIKKYTNGVALGAYASDEFVNDITHTEVEYYPDMRMKTKFVSLPEQTTNVRSKIYDVNSETSNLYPRTCSNGICNYYVSKQEVKQDSNTPLVMYELFDSFGNNVYSVDPNQCLWKKEYDSLNREIAIYYPLENANGDCIVGSSNSVPVMRSGYDVRDRLTYTYHADIGETCFYYYDDLDLLKYYYDEGSENWYVFGFDSIGRKEVRGYIRDVDSDCIYNNELYYPNILDENADSRINNFDDFKANTAWFYDDDDSDWRCLDASGNPISTNTFNHKLSNDKLCAVVRGDDLPTINLANDLRIGNVELDDVYYYRQFGYDVASRVVSERIGIRNDNRHPSTYFEDHDSVDLSTIWFEFIILYEYDSKSRLTTIRVKEVSDNPIYGDGSSIHYVYDDLNRLKSVYEGSFNQYSWNSDDLVSGYYTYEERGMVSSFVYGNGVETGFEYDTRGRLNNIVVDNGDVVFQQELNYDNIDNIKDITEDRRHEDNLFASFSYDLLNQLTSVNNDVTHPLYFGGNGDPLFNTQEFEYNSHGGRTSYLTIVDGDEFESIYDYDTQHPNRLDGIEHNSYQQNFQYDSRGNMLWSGRQTSMGPVMTYDSDNMITEILEDDTIEQYWYDENMNRILHRIGNKEVKITLWDVRGQSILDLGIELVKKPVPIKPIIPEEEHIRLDRLSFDDPTDINCNKFPERCTK